ncbi:MAG: hypothetical protein Q8P68_00695 [Candidatus Peregrinibacteria bacterium]|nr:hypothetical protein [Candidatus Peregrinibacteria bacterium]MDZ4245069.1 hypothetical protein [Candidatus Gracilibacteria bacterium]
MKKFLSKIPGLTLTILLIIILAINVAYAVKPAKKAQSPFNGLLQIVESLNPLGKNPTLPLIIGGPMTPDTTPSRPCILMPPEYYNPANPYDRWPIVTTWYYDVLNNFSGYIIDAVDQDSNNRFSEAVDTYTRPLPQNSFNNFCFNAGQDKNPYVDDDGDGEFNEDRPGGGDNDGDGNIDEDGWPWDGNFGDYGTLALYQGNENGDTGTNSNDVTYPVVDERRFMVVSKCDDPNTSTSTNEAYDANDVTCNGQFTSLNEYTAMIDQVDIEPGDIVRFGVYVHNNSRYPDNPSAIANDVLLQFDTKTNPNKPRAAISAPNNIYHENPYNTSSPTLRDVDDLDNDGNTVEILRMATDTTRVNSLVPILLTPIPDATWLYNEQIASNPPNSNNPSYHVPFRITNGSTTIIQDYGTPPSVPITETFDPSIVNEDFELGIDQVPGCFEFDGWYFFDYQVEAAQEPLCEELDVQWMQQWPAYEPLPVLRDEFILPADGNPPVPINFSDGTDEGLYIVGDSTAPLIIQINRNGYEGDLIWELVIPDGSGNLVPYQSSVDHFCSNAATGMQQDSCNSGTTMSDNNAGIIFNRFRTNVNSTLGAAYKQNTFKVYNLNQEVILHVYAPAGNGEKTSACKEAVYFPSCQDMTLIAPITLDDLTIDLATGIEIEVDTVPEFYNGPIVFGTDNQCGVFDIDDGGSDYTDDPNPLQNLTILYEVTVDFGINDPKTAWYNINTGEPGCSTNTGEGDNITIRALSDKRGFCEQTFTLTESEPQFCTDLEVSVQPDVYLDDGSDTMTATIDINASAGWSGTLAALVCASPTNPLLCVLSLDHTAKITSINIPTGSIFDTPGTVSQAAATIGPVGDGDQVRIQIENINNELSQLYVYALPIEPACSDITPFEWCGDGIINDGEACDDGNNIDDDDCSNTCEIGETPGECTDVELTTVPTPIYLEDTSTAFDVNIDVTADPTWTGSSSTMVCPAAYANDYTLCFIFRDLTVQITNLVLTPTGPNTFINFGQLNVGPLADGQQITFTASNISDPTDVIATFTFPEDPACNDSVPFEYCGDGIVNDGEDCDSANPLTPECTDSCEFPEGPFECTDLTLTTVPTPVYLEDSSTAFDTTIDVSADPAWAGSALEILVCSSPFTLTSCQGSLDTTAEISINTSPSGSVVTNDGTNDVSVDPVVDGNQVTATVTNISDPSNTIASFVINEPFCEDSSGFEYCGDGIVNDGEDCDSANPLTPECTDSCEFPEGPLACNDVLLTIAPTYLEEGTIVNGIITVSADTGWTGDLTIYVCDDPTSTVSCLATLDTTAEINSLPNVPSGFAAGPVQDGDVVTFQVENISNAGTSIAAFASGLGAECNDNANFSLCGDGIIDTGEACDDGVNNGTGPSECRADCTLPYCGDGIQDLTEDCDDGILNGTPDSTCSISCDTPGIPGTEGPTTCTDLEITSNSQINSIPAYIEIETNPNYWGETNTATFNYSSSNPNGIFSSNDGIGTGGFLNTNDKSVLYTGNIGDTISVSDSVQQFGACSDTITITEGPNPPNEPEGPDTPGDDDGGGDTPGGGDGDDGGGDNCPQLDIITPNPKILTAPEGYIEIVSPTVPVFDTGAPAYNGPFIYSTTDTNIKFVDTETLDGASAVDNYIYNSMPIPPSVWVNGDGETGLTTSSKEIFYFDADLSQDITIIVTDQKYPTSLCGDTLQNSIMTITGPQIEKFGWVHETGGNTTDQIEREVNYQISYWNSLTNPEDPDSYPREVVITDTMAEESINGHPGIYAVLDDGSQNTMDYVLYDYEDGTDYTNNPFITNFINREIVDASGDVVIKYYRDKPSVHWLQEGNDNTWGGDAAQIHECSEVLETYLTPILAEGEVAPPPPTYEDAGILCFTGRIDTADGITVYNMEADTEFELEYQGHIYASNFCDDETNTSLTESFPNTATGTYTAGTETETISDSETLYGTCKYALTRNAGDVLFYTDADPGANLAALTEDEVRNSDGLVFIRNLLNSVVETVFGGGVSGGTTASQCDNPDGNNLIPHVLSSFICQVYYDPNNTNDEWKPYKVNQKVDFEYLDGYGEFIDNVLLGDLSSSSLQNYAANYDPFAQLNDQGTRGKVYKFNGNVTIGNGQPIPVLEGGAKTIIVDGDLNINSDITYPNDINLQDHEISSIAFIVMGDINISTNVQNLAGVYVSRGGAFNNIGDISNKQLIFRGSVFGNLQPLINNRAFIGAPVLDGGNVVIRYDNRALRNTPPGLKDAIDLKWLRVAR